MRQFRAPWRARCQLWLPLGSRRAGGVAGCGWLRCGLRRRSGGAPCTGRRLWRCCLLLTWRALARPLASGPSAAASWRRRLRLLRRPGRMRCSAPPAPRWTAARRAAHTDPPRSCTGNRFSRPKAPSPAAGGSPSASRRASNTCARRGRTTGRSSSADRHQPPRHRAAF